MFGFILSVLCLAVQSPSLKDRLEPAIHEFLDSADAPGACVAVVRGDAVAYSGAFGMRNRSQKEAATVDTLFGVGSVTKIYTATLATLLVEQGEFELDDLVSDWLPEDASMPGADEVTVRHLLTHTSGLPRSSPTRENVEMDGPLDPGVAKPMSRVDLLKGLARTELRSPPGEQWTYSNFGLNLAGYVLECVMETPYEQLLKEKLLRPLQMENSVIQRNASDSRRYAAHYWTIDPERKERPAWVFGEVAAAGGLSCTISDLAKFVRFHLNGGPVLSDEGRLSMREPVIEAPLGPGGAQCIGWFRFEIPNGTEEIEVFAHGGEIDGHSAQILLAPSLHLGLAVQVNLGGSTAPDLGQVLLPLLLRP